MYNLVGKPPDRPESAVEYVDELEALRARLGAGRILPNHLIGCDFTVRAADVRRAAEERGFSRIPVLLSPDETLRV